MKLLDCTFRDGGYYTNWEFDSGLVNEYVAAFQEDQILELGYKSLKQSRGLWGRCDDNEVASVLNSAPPNLCFMIDLAEFRGSDGMSNLRKVVRPSYGSPFSYCRVAIKNEELDGPDLSNVVGFLRDEGYKVFVNQMDAFSLGVNQIEDFVLRTDHLPLEGVYFADSYGNLTPDVYERYHQAVSMSKHPKGFHGHDNLGLAFANALHLVNNKGYTYVDATVAGMGRGSGNTKTEQILVWAFAGHLADRFVRVLDKIEALKLKHGWGHSPEYMIAGLKRVHPAYVQKTNRLNLPRSKRLSTIFHLDGTIKYDEQMLPPTKAGVIIPAREASSRFHNKPMALIKGKAMILWVCEAAARAVGESNVVVATDSVKIADAVREAGFEAVTTSPNCLTGTDRVAEAAEKLPFDIVVNVQGDEPLIQPEDILRVIKTKEENPDYIINCFSKILPEEDALSTKIPKVVLTEDNELLYMSRGNVPCDKDGTPAAYKQVCIYGFNREDLALYHSSQKTRAESVEDIEILRFLEKGRRVKMIETFNKGVAVDFPEDVAKVERILNEV